MHSEFEKFPAQLAYSVNDAVLVSGLSRTVLYGLMQSGALPRRKVGKRTLILASDLQAYLESLPVDAGK